MLDKDLTGVGVVAFTSDGWQASNNKCFLSVTAHYITENYEYKSLLLECKGYKGSHKGAAIAAVLTDILKDYPALMNPNLKRVLTTDAASNMAKAIDECDHFEDQVICVAHILNNSIQEAVSQNTSVHESVNKFKALSQQLHKSSVNLAILEEYCQENRGNLYNSFQTPRG